MEAQTLSFLSQHSNRIEQLTQKLGGPFFIYDLDGLYQHLQKINSSNNKQNGIRFFYATKANPLSAILKTVKKAGLGVDVASHGEFSQALSCGVAPKDILTTGPVKTSTYLNECLKKNVSIYVIESEKQLEHLNRLSKDFGIKPRCLLRVQLNWGQGQSVLGGSAITPFGLDEQAWSEVKLSLYPHLDIIGLHVFQWGNLLDEDRIIEIWQHTLEKAQALAKELRISAEVLDLGGGLGIPYDQDDPSMELNFQNLMKRLIELKNKNVFKEIWMELGRYAIGPFGYYFCKVEDKKKVRGKNLLILSGGVNHLVRPALTKQFFPCQDLKNQQEKILYQLHGPLCTALDFLGEFELSANIDEGDWICFSQCGAYGFTESMPYFLCHTLPGEITFEKGRYHILRNPAPPKIWMK